MVAVDALTYYGFKGVAEAQRLELAPVPVSAGDRTWTRWNACAARAACAPSIACRRCTIRWAGCWIWQGRRRLVDIARRHDLIVIEDQVYGYLVHPQPAPLAAAPERTVYVSGLSKSVAAGLRVGFIAAPDAWLPAMERVIRSSTWNTPAVMSAIACMWMEDGTVAALEQAKREDAQVRQALARRVLADLPVVAHPSSYFLWIPLAEEARADQIAMSLQRQQWRSPPPSRSPPRPRCRTRSGWRWARWTWRCWRTRWRRSGERCRRIEEGSGSSSAVSSALSITASIPVRVSRLAVKPAIASRSAGQ